MTNWSQDFTVKSNARRAAKKANVDPAKVVTSVKAGKTLYRFPLDATEAPKAAKPATKTAKATKAKASKPPAPAKAKKAKTPKAKAAKTPKAKATPIERLRASVVNDGAAKPSTKADRGLKFTAVAALLRRANGASITEVCAATGWLPHSARARISVDVSKLLNKGEEIKRVRHEDGVSVYFIVPSKQMELPGVDKDAA